MSGICLMGFCWQLVSVFLRDSMSVEEFLASACNRKSLNPMEHFVRVKKRRDMEDHNYFVPHRTDAIETYVSILCCLFYYFLSLLLFNIFFFIFNLHLYLVRSARTQLCNWSVGIGGPTLVCVYSHIKLYLVHEWRVKCIFKI